MKIQMLQVFSCTPTATFARNKINKIKMTQKNDKERYNNEKADVCNFNFFIISSKLHQKLLFLCRLQIGKKIIT
jgi:hypothetical protein